MHHVQGKDWARVLEVIDVQGDRVTVRFADHVKNYFVQRQSAGYVFFDDEGQVHTISAAALGESGELWSVGGSALQAELRVSQSKRNVRTSDAPDAVSGQQTLRAPMPGRVVEILVQPGAQVNAGQGLLVLEAMKMENEIRAQAAGSVETIHVHKGDNVELDQQLVTLVV